MTLLDDINAKRLAEKKKPLTPKQANLLLNAAEARGLNTHDTPAVQNFLEGVSDPPEEEARP